MKRENLAILRLFEDGKYMVLSSNNLILEEGVFDKEDESDMLNLHWYEDNGYVDCMADTWTI